MNWIWYLIENITQECIERGFVMKAVEKYDVSANRKGITEMPFIQKCQNECPLLNYL
jgi:hypothetical protein